MGCFKSKLSSRARRKGSQQAPAAFCARHMDAEATSRLSGEDVLKQLREEGIVPSRQATGGVAFDLTVDDRNGAPLRKPPRRLARLAVKPKSQYTRDERHMIAEITQFDRMVERVQKKALDRACKRRLVLQEKERRNAVKKLEARAAVASKEMKLKKFQEERNAARKMAGKKAAEKRKAVQEAKKALAEN